MQNENKKYDLKSIKILAIIFPLFGVFVQKKQNKETKTTTTAGHSHHPLIFKEILLVWKTPLNAPLWNNISP